MNYVTYYNRGQKVFLINISPDRDQSLFEAFSATIVSCDNRHFELRPRYSLLQAGEGLLRKGAQFKVTAESFGSGVQFSGEIGSVSGSSFILNPTGPIEMYQRSQVPRMDMIVGFRSFTRTTPLAVFHQEWRRLQDGFSSGKSSPLELAPRQINLGVGGLRVVAEPDERQHDLSMIFIELEAGQAPICAVTEQLWRRNLPDEEGVATGQRFVLIRKEDQLRIQQHIEQRLKKQGRKPKPSKNNWELLDRMFRST
ncbi:MAG: hypothetical protein AB7T17_05030 [Geobacter sp.]|jgi:hypothetical protein